MRNAALLALNTAISGAVGFVAWVVVARAVPAAAFGAAQGLVAAMTVAALVANAGLGTALVQELPALTGDAWRRTAGGACLLAAALGAVGGCVAWAVVAVVAPSLLTAGALSGLLLIGAVTLWTISLVLDLVCVAARRARGVVVRNAVFAVVKLALTVALVVTGTASAVTVFATWVGATAVSVVVAATIVSSFGHGRLAYAPARATWRQLHRASLGNHVVNLGAQVPGYVVPLLVVAILGARYNAYYAAASMACGLLGAWSPAIAQSMLAEVSHGRAFAAARRRVVGVLASTLLPAVVLSIVLRGPLLGLFGAAYPHAAGPLFVLLVLGTIPDAVSNVCVVGLRQQRRYAAAARVNATIGITIVVASAVLLGRIGLVGAGAAWVGAQSLGALLAPWELHRRAKDDAAVEPAAVAA